MTMDRENEEENLSGPAPGAAHPGFVRSALIFYGLMGCAALIWRMAVPGESILYPSNEASVDAWGPIAALIAGEDQPKSKRAAKAGGRKRLGKSLKEMDATPVK